MSTNPSSDTKMPKWGYWLIGILSALFIFQTGVIFYQTSQKKSDEPRVMETAVQADTRPLTFPPRRSAAQLPSSPQPVWQMSAFSDPFMDDAFASLERLAQHMNRAFDRFATNTVFGSFMPSIDLKETEDAYIIHSDIPGLEKDKIDLTVRGNVLTIEGVRESQSESGSEDSGFYSRERSYGAFSRSVALPGAVDETNVKAEYKDGVLTVTLPKAEGAKEKSTIQIQ